MPTATAFRLRDLTLTAYAPTLISSLGYGAVTPMVALRARELGADVALAALVVSMVGVGMLLSSLPTGALIARLGERRALLIASVVDAAAMAGAALSPSVAALGLAAVVSGMAWTAFLIARQGFLIEVVPPAYRARAMSTMGGTFRIGLFVGPLIGAGLIHLWGLVSVFVFAAVMSLLAGLVAQTMPDVGAERRVQDRVEGFESVRSVLWAHRGTLATLGVVVVVISASRAVRTTLLPLWADQLGISASTTSLIFSLIAFIDIVMFYPGGWLMDRHGRTVVAVPVVLGVAIACLLLPSVHGLAGLAGVMAVIAFSNGLSSGIVLTLGADVAPVVGRAQFLGGWRLCGDIGNTGGPLLISLLAGLAGLATAATSYGVLALLGTGWVALWTRRLDRRLRAQREPSPVSRP